MIVRGLAVPNLGLGSYTRDEERKDSYDDAFQYSHSMTGQSCPEIWAGIVLHGICDEKTAIYLYVLRE
jgi:hypothetical protein